MSKELRTRIQHKIDTAEKWNKSTIKPLEGELIIYSNGNATANLDGILPDLKAPAFKIGDGVHKVGELPFATLGIEVEPDVPGGDDPVKPDPENPTITVVSIPQITSGTMIYNGSTITPTWSTNITNSEYFTCEGALSGTDAGTYTTIFKLKNTETTKWSNDSTEPQTVTWQIQKATYTLQVANNQLTFESINSVAPVNQQVVVKTMANVNQLMIGYSSTTGGNRVTVKTSTKSGPDAEGFYSYTYDLSCTSFVTNSTETISFRIYKETNYNDQIISITINCIATSTEDITDFESLSWSRIAEIVESGNIPEEWAIGDKKKVQLNGYIRDVNVGGMEAYASIIGINQHCTGPEQRIANPSKKSIDLVLFDTVDGKPLALYDPSQYKKQTYSDKYWTMNRWARTLKAGWKYSYMRNQVLGSSSNINTQKDSFMRALPQDLRENLAPMYVLTSTEYSSSKTDVIHLESVYDYLKLPCLGEITTGINDNGDPAEFDAYSDAEYDGLVHYDYNELRFGVTRDSDAENNLQISTDPVIYWTRTFSYDSYNFAAIWRDPADMEGSLYASTTSFEQNYSLAICPIFRIGNVYGDSIEEFYYSNQESGSTVDPDDSDEPIEGNLWNKSGSYVRLYNGTDWGALQSNTMSYPAGAKSILIKGWQGNYHVPDDGLYGKDQFYELAGGLGAHFSVYLKNGSALTYSGKEVDFAYNTYADCFEVLDSDDVYSIFTIRYTPHESESVQTFSFTDSAYNNWTNEALQNCSVNTFIVLPEYD